MTINNFAGTLFRFSVFAFFIAELASIGGGGGNTDTGDYFACAGSIVLFCALMLFEKEKIHPAAPVCFGITKYASACVKHYLRNAAAPPFPAAL